jgi:arylsulfatase A-like enzyme
MTLWADEQLPVPVGLERYAQEAELIDREIGRLLQGLREQGLAERTLIVVSNDHGEGLWNHELPGHVEQLYGEAVHSPALVYLPGRIAPQLVDVPAQHVDLLPTVLDLLGLPAKPDVQGQSLAGALRGLDGNSTSRGAASALSPDRELYLQTFPPEAGADKRALLRGRWKLITTEPGGRRELYDLAGDPAELVDRSAERPDLVNPMAARLAELERLVGRPAVQGPRPDAVSQEQMRALGYVQ